MRSRSKTTLILLSVVAIVSIAVLASGISNITFSTGQPISFQNNSSTRDGELLPLSNVNLDAIWKVISTLFLWVLIPASIIYFILSPEVRIESIKRALYLSVFAYSIFILIRQFGKLNPNQLLNIDLNPGSLSGEDQGISISDILLTAPPQWVLWVSSGFLLLIFGYIFARIYRQNFKLDDLPGQLKNEAEDALNEILSGGDIRKIISRCYHEMSALIAKTTGLKRDRAITVREFEDQINEIGILSPEMQRLTKLFEKFRYGNIEPDKIDEQEAISCLRGLTHDLESIN